MNLRHRFKHWLYGSCPGYAGVFPYFSERIHFPRGSMLFTLACEQGIFEHENIRILRAAARPGSWYFDVGANIGLMSAPLLDSPPGLTIVSVEASPRTAECLGRTIAASPRRNRWHFVPKALGAGEGEIEFFASTASHGVFDGLRDTGRGRDVSAVKVPLTQLDTLWLNFGRPDVSLIKIDTEGAEADVLCGAMECLRATRPCVLLEWNALNLAPFGTPSMSLLTFAADLDYDVLAGPALVPVATPEQLRLQMGLGETFVLSPRP